MSTLVVRILDQRAADCLIALYNHHSGYFSFEVQAPLPQTLVQISINQPNLPVFSAANAFFTVPQQASI